MPSNHEVPAGAIPKVYPRAPMDAGDRKKKIPKNSVKNAVKPRKVSRRNSSRRRQVFMGNRPPFHLLKTFLYLDAALCYPVCGAVKFPAPRSRPGPPWLDHLDSSRLAVGDPAPGNPSVVCDGDPAGPVARPPRG